MSPSSPSLSVSDTDNTPSSTSSSRQSLQIHAASEIEMDDQSSLSEDVLTPSVSSFNMGPKASPSPSPSSSLQKAEEDDTTPVKSKSTPGVTGKGSSKVKAAAAMFETKSSPPTFRSVPVNTSTSPIKKLTPSPKRSPSTSPSPSPSTISKNVLKSPESRLNSPFVNRSVSPSSLSINTPSPSSANIEKFQEVSLSNDTPQAESQLGETATTPTSLTRQRSNPPVPMNISDTPPEPVTTPPAKDPPSIHHNNNKTSFFGSSLNFGFPSSSASTSTTEPESGPSSSSQQPSRSGSTSSQGGTTGGWKSTMTSFLTSTRSNSSNNHTHSHAHTVEEDPKTPVRPTILERNPSEGTSSAFLLHRVDSSTASRDRRISAQLGGGQAIRAGFERVKNEMEFAAREMRREREIKALTESEDEDGTEEEEEEMVDWNFWGSVVQDFENVARERPKELSKAIQMGIPPVIRGAIWQLMSSSKSTPLEETYKALLKIPSTHEKAIKKDLNRTFPNHKYYQDNAGIGQEGLFMVVKAYSLYDPEVGYTQGLAFIVAALLLNMPDEEAFCVLVRLMDSYNLRSHYTAEMRGLQLRLFQFDRLVEEILPLLHTHFVRQGVKSSIYAAQWFMTLFSYRFPLSLVYRVLDTVFAEGIEAIFRFSLALLKKSEDKLLELEFEQILNFLQSDLFQVYRVHGGNSSPAGSGSRSEEEEEWKANEFVRDAYEIRITPFMLDSYASEWDEQQKNQNRHALEIDTLRNANRNLSAQVKQLESSLATMNQEHVELVRQLVMSKIEKEEIENELVRYKMLYAELAHAQQDALSTHSRLSGGSIQSQNMGFRPPS
ncbi:hypothetical protein V865_007130 [Kwoniella europaea PYCC6329]|uniref:GTPase-activating protein GYP5 n=1 Tax=Kwoniella europaea PYCC6329 TaxID=1423913 RepID=A0AAX4KSI6_9TREE